MEFNVSCKSQSGLLFIARATLSNVQRSSLSLSLVLHSSPLLSPATVATPYILSNNNNHHQYYNRRMDMEDDSSVSSSSMELSPTSSSSCSSKRKAGRKKFRETRHPVYRGVRERKGGKWVCEVRKPNSKSRIWLGTYPTPEMAARAHDVAAIALRSKSAPLNFPGSASALPRPKSASPDDIRCAATEAAEMYRSCTPPPRPSSSEEQEGAGEPAASVYVDEEELFNMPSLLVMLFDSMAEGMLLTPPGVHKGLDWDAVECHTDWSLWND